MVEVMTLTGVCMILGYAVFYVWRCYRHMRHEDDELWQKRQELLDSLPPLSNSRRPK